MKNLKKKPIPSLPARRLVGREGQPATLFGEGLGDDYKKNLPQRSREH